MNVKASVERLADNMRRLIAAHPAVPARLREGMSLHEVLSSPAWAQSWAAGADELARLVLKRLLVRFGANAFEAEKGEAECARDGRITGAEWRAAMAVLRRSGVVFAVRKTWGERLFYIPVDMVPVWQRILLPARAQPLPSEAAGQVRREPYPPRLPLPLEMLCVWSHIRRKGVALTAKGAIARPAAARLAQESRLQAEELTALRLAYPQQDIVPPGAALALDLGLWTGVLRRGEKEIAAYGVLPAWMGRSMAEVNAAFYRMVMERYAAADPQLHLAASAAMALRTEVWYEDGALASCGIDREAAHNWVRLLAAFGWAERGVWQDRGCFRLSPDLAGLAGTSGGEPEEEGCGIVPAKIEEGCRDEIRPAAEEDACYIIQPDGEIWVPPQTRLTERWFLEEIAERVTADRMFVYRLSRSSCAGGFAQGRSEAAVRARLEQGSGAPLPEPVAEALTGWFRSFGRVRIVEHAVLLCADSAEIAERLLEDEELAACFSERIGERYFLADGRKLAALKKRLAYLGYDAPVSQGSSGAVSSGAGESGTGTNASDAEAQGGEAAWIWRPHGQLAVFRPDDEADTKEAIFPGLAKVPSAWLTRPGDYHPATRRQLISQAIAWKAAVRIGCEAGGRPVCPAIHQRARGAVGGARVLEAGCNCNGAGKLLRFARTDHAGGGGSIAASDRAAAHGRLCMIIPARKQAGH